MKLDAEDVQVHCCEHLSFIGSDATQQVHALGDKLADSSANIHDFQNLLLSCMNQNWVIP